MRQQLRRGGNAVSFFAFQDIITAVIGILLLITLLLILFVGMDSQQIVTPDSVRQPASPPEIERLQSLLAEMTNLENKLRIVKAASSSSSEAELNALRNELSAVLTQISAKGTTKPGGAKSSELSAEIADMEATANQSKQHLAELERRTTEARNRIAEAEKKLESAQQDKLEEEAKKNDLFLIPDQATTSKSPLLLDVKEHSISIQGLDGTSVQANSSSSGDIASMLKNYPKSDYYVVIYYRPSTFHLVSDINESVRKLGYEIGYDLLRDDQSVRLGPGEKP